MLTYFNNYPKYLSDDYGAFFQGINKSYYFVDDFGTYPQDNVINNNAPGSNQAADRYNNVTPEVNAHHVSVNYTDEYVVEK